MNDREQITILAAAALTGLIQENDRQIANSNLDGNYSPPSPATFSRTHNRKDFRRQEVRTAV